MVYVSDLRNISHPSSLKFYINSNLNYKSRENIRHRQVAYFYQYSYIYGYVTTKQLKKFIDKQQKSDKITCYKSKPILKR